MARDTHFRWRTTPAVIGQYYLGDRLPSGQDVTLKPDEACVVLEDGRLITVITQQTIELDPKVGVIARFFGKEDKRRSYLFVHMGPHDLLARVNGRTSDGHEVHGLANLRVELVPEEAARLLQVPAKGDTTITRGTLASALESELNAKVIGPELGRTTAAGLRDDPMFQRDLAASIEVEMRGSLSALGLRMKGAWTNWVPSEHDRLIEMRRQLESEREKTELLSEQEAAQAERIINRRLQTLELEHRLKTAELTQEAREHLSATLADLQAQRELERGQWDVMFARRQRQLDAQVTEQQAMLDMQATQRQAGLEMEHDRVARDAIRLKGEQARKDADFAEAERARAVAREEAAVAAAADEDAAQSGHLREQAGKDAEMRRAMGMFDQVQAAKRQRMVVAAGQEKQRIDHLAELKRQEMGLTERIMVQALDKKIGEASTVGEMLRQQTASKQMDVTALDAAYIDPGASSGGDGLATGSCASCGSPVQAIWSLCANCGASLR